MENALRGQCRYELLEVFVKSPVRENRSPGSVRGAWSNPRPYLDIENLRPVISDGAVPLPKLRYFGVAAYERIQM